MAKLSAGEIAEHAYNAGFRGQALTTAVAIALAESGGDPKVKGDTTITDGKWGPSIGLWQIRSLHKDNGTGGERDAKANRNPATNARHAWSISRHGTYWTPWSVYTNGSYRSHLDTARSAARHVQRNGKGSDGKRSGDRAGGKSGGSRVVLDLQELRGLQTFFDHAADRMRHVRRSVRDVDEDLAPARAALTDTGLSALITQTLRYLQSPAALPKAEERMDWHARYAERVRKLAERADGEDNKWTRADAARFRRSAGAKPDRAEQAVLEGLRGGVIVRHSRDLRHHLDRDAKGASGGGRLSAVDTSRLRNGNVLASRLAPVGEGEKLLTSVARQFRRMDAAARVAGVNLHVNDGYRTYAEQEFLYQKYLNGAGSLAARPGTSTHGIGLSVDIQVPDARTEQWLRANAAKYGFVNDVPIEKWHWTYKPGK